MNGQILLLLRDLGPTIWDRWTYQEDEVHNRKEQPPSTMVWVVHAADSGGKGRHKEQDIDDVIDHIPCDEMINDNRYCGRYPAKENEVPVLTTARCPIDRESLVESRCVGLEEVWHLRSLIL